MNQAVTRPLKMDGIMIRPERSSSAAMPTQLRRRAVTHQHVKDRMTVQVGRGEVIPHNKPSVEPAVPKIKSQPKTNTTAAIRSKADFSWIIPVIRGAVGFLVVVGVLLFSLDRQLPLDSTVGLAYLAMAIMFRIESQWSFGLGLLCLLVVAFDSITKIPAPTTSDMFAIYAFYFLVIGTIQAAIDLKFEPGRIVQVRV